MYQSAAWLRYHGFSCWQKLHRHLSTSPELRRISGRPSRSDKSHHLRTPPTRRCQLTMITNLLVFGLLSIKIDHSVSNGYICNKSGRFFMLPRAPRCLILLRLIPLRIQSLCHKDNSSPTLDGACNTPRKYSERAVFAGSYQQLRLF